MGMEGLPAARAKMPGAREIGAAISGPTILFKIITRMKLLFSNYLGGYSYSFQGSSELISITITVSLFFLQNGVIGKNSPQEFSRVFGNYSYMI